MIYDENRTRVNLGESAKSSPNSLYDDAEFSIVEKQRYIDIFFHFEKSRLFFYLTMNFKPFYKNDGKKFAPDRKYGKYLKKKKFLWDTVHRSDLQIDTWT